MAMKIRGQVVRLKENGAFVNACGDTFEFISSGTGLYPPLVFPADLPIPLELIYHPLEAPTRQIVAEDVDIYDVEFEVPDSPNGSMVPSWHASETKPKATGCHCACDACGHGQCCNRGRCGVADI